MNYKNKIHYTPKKILVVSDNKNLSIFLKNLLKKKK